MGTTCFCHVEFSAPAGNWLYLGPLHLSKNYHLFAALAGVRNGTWGMRVRPIAPPRGLPRDVTSEVAEDAEEMRAYSHSHTWLSVEELLGFDWEQEVPHQAVIDLENPLVRKWFENGNRKTAPPGYAHSIASKNGLPANRYRVEGWTQKLAIDVKDFLEGVLPYLKYLAFAYMGKSPKTRIVLWFKD